MLQSEAECLAQYTKKAIETFAAKMEDSFPYIYEMRKDQSGKCIFLKDNQCKVYDFRPMICCFYPFELSTRQDGIYVFSETDECPIICNPENSEVLTLNYFEELLKLAVEKFRGISNAEK
jgi:Fe-S-cluster containining protein